MSEREVGEIDRRIAECLTAATMATNELVAMGRDSLRVMAVACDERDRAQRALGQLQEELRCGAINRAAAEAIANLADAQQEAYEAATRAQAAEAKLAAANEELGRYKVNLNAIRLAVEVDWDVASEPFPFWATVDAVKALCSSKNKP